ncbi:nucleoside transporter [Klebsiella aerogenes]|nr:nucleoside transporter [Klebsiella aerogenes]
MAAPGGLLFAKIIVPETEKPDDNPAHDSQSADADKPANVLDAAASGAASGMQLALNVGAMLLAFIALIALLNGILSGVGGWFNHPELSLQMILGWIFSPLAWVIGVPWHEATVAGSFIGQKLIINEFVAYMNFGEYLKADAEVAAAGLQVISDHTKAIISFALCGFANLSSIAILIGDSGNGAQPAAGYRSAWATCGSGGDAVQPDERHHRRGFSRPVSLSPEPAAPCRWCCCKCDNSITTLFFEKRFIFQFVAFLLPVSWAKCAPRYRVYLLLCVRIITFSSAV